MIFDKLANASLYYSVHPNFKKAFDFLNHNNLSTLANGKHEIEGDDVFALVQTYETKTADNCKIEGHFKYIDIQFIVKGIELIGVTTLANQNQMEKNIEHDYAFYEGEMSFMKMSQGMFAIFYPDDLHMPGVQIENSSEVKKIVLKVRINSN